MDYSLKEILDNVEQIREAIYGEEVRGSISDSIEMMAYETDTIQGFKDGVDQSLADFKSQYEQNFRDFADSIHRDMNQFETKINDDFAGFKSEVNLAMNNHKVEMDNKFVEFKQSVHLTIADFTNDMTTKMDTIQDEWIKFQQTTSLDIANFKMEMQNKYQEFTERIIKENSELKESVKTDIAGMKNDIMNFKDTTEQTLAQYQQELGETITSWDKTLTDKLAQHTTEMEAIKKEIYDKLDEASQADPNLELVDAREGETTLKENLNKNYTKKSELEPLQTSISELTETTTTLGGRTDKLEQYVTKYPNPVLTINQQSPDDTGNIDIGGGNIEATEVTYSELTQLIANNELVTGGIYLLTNYKTIYQQPVSNDIKSGETEELYLTATSTNTLSPIAYSKQYPQDIIIYDVNNKVAEDTTTPRNGFILRRTDTVNNLSAPQDWRTMKWLRYDISDTHYNNGTQNVPYEVWQSGQETKMDVVYKVGNELYIAHRVGVPTDNTSANYFTRVCRDITNKLYAKASPMDYIKITSKLSLLTANADYLPTFGAECQNIYIEDMDNRLHNNVFKDKCANILLGKGCWENSFDNNTRNIKFDSGCRENTLTSVSSHNTLGCSSSHNLFIDSGTTTLGTVSSYNIFINSSTNRLSGSNSSNVFIQSHHNILSTSASTNTFYCSIGNTLNQYCTNHVFNFGSSGNVIGASSTENIFGQYCTRITLGQGCQSNTFGDSCYYIIFGNECNSNTIGSNSSQIQLGSECNNNKFGDRNKGITTVTNCQGNKFGANCTDITCLGKVLNCTFGNNMFSVNIYRLLNKDVTQVSDLYNKVYDIVIQKSNGTDTFQYGYLDNATSTMKYFQIP